MNRPTCGPWPTGWSFSRAEVCARLNLPARRLPSLSTLQRTVAALEFSGLRTCLAGHARELLRWWQGGQSAARQAWGLDGKEARGARRRGEAVLVVNLMDHASGFVMDQLVVPAQTNEIPVGPIVVRSHELAGVVVTADAAHTQHAFVAAVREQGGHYLLVAKDNQPTLAAAIAELFATPPGRRFQPVEDRAETRDYGHGRYETRVMETSTLLCAWLAW